METQFIEEIKLHSCLDHPTIVKFYGFFDEGEYIYIIMEYVNGGTLFDYQNNIGILSVKEAA
jgi:aurora kinase